MALACGSSELNALRRGGVHDDRTGASVIVSKDAVRARDDVITIDGPHVSDQGEDDRTLLAIGTDHRLYSQPFAALQKHSEWEVAASGNFTSLAVLGATVLAVGENHRVYRRSLASLPGTGDWAVASATGVKWIAVQEGAADTEGFIFAIGAEDGLLYRQRLRTMTVDSAWQGPFCQGTPLVSVAVAEDTLFGVGPMGRIYTQAATELADCLAWAGPISDESNITSFAVAGSDILGIGRDHRVYRQASSNTWTLAGSGSVRALAVSGPRPRWLPNDPAWSRGGMKAAGVWASSVADDEWGTPFEEGPQSLLRGEHWRTKWGSVTNQWFVLDLGRPTLIDAVRVKGWSKEPAKSPKEMRWQSGASRDGPWTTAAAFVGSELGEWVVAEVERPVASRWWRLLVKDIWGSGDLGEDMCIVGGFQLRGARSSVSPEAEAEQPDDSDDGCRSRFVPPQKPRMATDGNGANIDEVCFGRDKHDGKHHVFIIGDWGGIVYGKDQPPRPADHRSPVFTAHQRKFIQGVDDCAQLLVAAQMRLRAPKSRPDYVINAGDNMYWGGLRTTCGAELGAERTETGQWGPIFEHVYHGPALDGVQWLGVLGNHDYGGFMFNAGWDQTIGYTWADDATSTGRWFTPAQYWKSKVRYPDFTVDLFFVDSNVYDAFEPDYFVGHNLCSIVHNPKHATCAPQGPKDIWDCPGWFQSMWSEQQVWLEHHLGKSSADWQVIVTHFPPEYGTEFWAPLTRKYGVDLYISGHRHRQEVWQAGAKDNPLNGTAFVVSGGGGGITSQEEPDRDGNDDQYGFVDVTLSRETITLEAVTHSGKVRSTTVVRPKSPGPGGPAADLQSRRRRGAAAAGAKRGAEDSSALRGRDAGGGHGRAADARGDDRRGAPKPPDEEGAVLKKVGNESLSVDDVLQARAAGAGSDAQAGGAQALDAALKRKTGEKKGLQLARQTTTDAED